MSFDFNKLEVYKKAKLFYFQISAVLENNSFPRHVNDQLSRASFSVALNIAEGSGRFSKRDRRNFYIISRSSVWECVAILDILNDQNKIEEQWFKNSFLIAEDISKILFKMIRNLE